MYILSSRRSKISTGTLFVLGLFLVGVMMCSATLFFSPAGHHFLVKGCDQVSAMISYVIFDRGQELLTIFVLFSLIFTLGVSWKLSNIKNNHNIEQPFKNKPHIDIVRAMVDPVLLSFRHGVIRNLSYS